MWVEIENCFGRKWVRRMGEREERWSCIKDENGGWRWERMKCQGLGRIILRTRIIWKLKSRLLSTYVALVVFHEAIILKESQLGGLKMYGSRGISEKYMD